MRNRLCMFVITLLVGCFMCLPQYAFADDEGLSLGDKEIQPETQTSPQSVNDASDDGFSKDVAALPESNGAAETVDGTGDQESSSETPDQEPEDICYEGETVVVSSRIAEDDQAESNQTAVDDDVDGIDLQGYDVIVDTADNDADTDEMSTDSVSPVTAAAATPVTAAPVKTAAKQTAAPTIKNGWYTIKSLLNSSFALCVKGLKKADGTKIQLKKGVTSAGYAFKFKKVGKYYRIIVGIATKKSVQIVGVKNGSGGIVSINGKKNRSTLFKLKYNQELGAYQFINVKTKQVLSVKGGKAKNGAKIVGAKNAVGAKSQLFRLAARPGLVTTNIYSIKTVQKGKRALTASGSKGRFYKYIKDSDQKWYIAPVAGKKNVYVIESISTGKRLTGVKNKMARVKAASNANKYQWWVPSFGEKGIIWKNYRTKKPLSTAGSKCAEGSKAMNKKYDDKTSREFRLTKRTPVESGVYMLVSGANAGLDLEVAGNKTTAGALVQVNTADASLNEKWFYNASARTLKNVNSNLMLEAKTADDGSMIVQAASTGAKSQSWTFTYAGGGKFQLVSGVNKNYVLSAVGNASAAATNSKNSQSNTQKWKVIPTTAQVQPKGFKLVKSIVKNGHGPLKATYIVIHETANPGATAKNHRDLWAGDNYYSDYAVHYVLDWTGVCYYCVPENRLCWQVGNGNKYVVGIELCHATNKSDFKKVWDGGVSWAAWQLKKNGWGIDRLISHNECRVKWGGTDHTDPDDYFEEFGQSWSKFKAAVKKALANY